MKLQLEEKEIEIEMFEAYLEFLIIVCRMRCIDLPQQFHKIRKLLQIGHASLSPLFFIRCLFFIRLKFACFFLICTMSTRFSLIYVLEFIMEDLRNLTIFSGSLKFSVSEGRFSKFWIT